MVRACLRRLPRPASCLTVLATILLTLATAPPAQAQGWRRVVQVQDTPGSAIGGASGNTLYAGLSSGHVFRSSDNGLTWTAITNGLVDASGRMLLPKAFLTLPSGRVLRGGDNASWQNKIGSPVFVLDPPGATWTEIPLPFSSPARNPAGIAVSDLVLHQGAVYFSDLLSEGVWRSTDQGATWTAVGADLPTAPFIGFAKTYYALASAGDALLTIQASKGVFRSTNAGATWSQSVQGIPGVPDSPLVGGRTWAGSDIVGAPDGTAFAVVDGRLYRSRDGGASWTELGNGILVSPNPFVPSVIGPSARKVEVLGDRVYVSTGDSNPRFFEGSWDGASWTELPRVADNQGNASLLAQSFAAHQGALYFAGEKGIHRLDLATAVRTALPPQVTVSPAGPYGLNVGSTLRISALALGTAPFTYEWRLGNLPIPGQTGPELVFTADGSQPSGDLSLVVGNAAGTVTVPLGPLTVATTGPGAIDYAFRPVVSGTTGIGAVTALAFGPDGSVFLGGGLYSQLGAYTGVRKVFPDGTPDPSFVSGAVIGSGSGPGATVGLPQALLPLGDGSVLVGAAGTGDNQRYYRRLLPNGALDPSWPWPPEIAGGPYQIERLPDGRFLVAGGSVGGLHRLNADGSFDPTFRGPTSIGTFQRDYVQRVVVLPDGHLLIAGAFDTVDGAPRVGLARLLPHGPLDRSWIPAALPMGSEVYALAVQADGRILIGGAFTSVGNQSRRYLARLHPDGSLDPSLPDLIPNTAPGSTVRALALQPDGRAWVAGNFLGVGGRNYLLRLTAEGTVDSSFPDLGFTANPDIRTLAWTGDGRLWIGCASTTVGDRPAGQLFRIFTDVQGPTMGYAGLDQTPDPGVPVLLRATIPGPYTRLQWRFEGSPLPGATDPVLSLGPATAALSGRYDLVITSPGGTFTTRPATVRVRGPVILDLPPQPAVVAISNSVTFAVTAFGRLPLEYQWFRDGVALSSATQRTLVLTNLALRDAGDYHVRVTGGDGSLAESEPAYLAVVPRPGSAMPGFQPALFPSPSGTAFKDLVFLPDGGVVVGGSFALQASGTPNARLARLGPDGAVDPGFQFDSSAVAELVAVERQPDGRLVTLQRLNSGGAPYVVRRLLESGAPDPSFTEFTVQTGSDVRLLADGGILALGSTGAFRLHADGTPDTGFNTRARLNGAAVAAAEDPSGRLYLAGTFTTVGGVPRPQLARLRPDGTLDTDFLPSRTLSNPGTLAALPDGVLVGDANGFHRFGTDGLQDPTYAWASRLAAWDSTSSGDLAGLLANTTGDGVFLDAAGVAALPFGSFKAPPALYGYSFLRIAPDGALWVALGSIGAEAPAKLLHRLHGTIQPLALVSVPGSQTVDAGTPVTFTASAVGTSRVAYQWSRNGVDLTGATNALLTLAAAEPADAGDYTVRVRNRSGSLTSRPATLVVLAEPELLSFSGGGELGLGSRLHFAATARGIAPLEYTWRRNGTPIPGATASSFTNPAVALTDAGIYDLVIRNSRGSLTSPPAPVTVVVRPGRVLDSFPDLGLGQGVKELNVLPDGSFLADGVARDRFGTRLFALPLTTTDLREKIVVDPGLGRIYMVDGPRLAFDLQGAPLTAIPRPPINMRSVRLEASGSLLVTDNGISSILQRISPEGTVVPGLTPALRPVIDALPLPDGRIVVLSYTQRTAGNSLVYDTVVARLQADGSFDPTFARPSQTLPLGRRAEHLALDHEGRILVVGAFTTFQGQPRTGIARLLDDGTLDPGFQPPTIDGEIVEVAEQRNGKLVIVGAFTRVDGLPRNLVARLHADGTHDAGFDPGAGLTRTGGQNVAFDVKILPQGEILVAGTFDAADGVPRRGLALLTGDTLDLYFSREPADAEVALGGTVTLVAEGAGTSPVTYAWTRDGQPIPGQTGPSLVLSDATAATAGQYRALIRNAAGELASRAARVAVVVPPRITRPPETRVADPGQPASFTVEAEGLHLAFQWRHEGTNLPAATNATLLLPAVALPDAGTYSVRVSNPAGAAESTPARLRLRPVLVSGEPPTNGLLAELRFEGNVQDSRGGLSPSPVGSLSFVPGVRDGQAVRIRGGMDWVVLAGASQPPLDGAFSAAFWIRPEETTSLTVYSFALPVSGLMREHLLVLGGDDAVAAGHSLRLVTRGFTAVHSDDPRARVSQLVNRWSHLVVTYAGSAPNRAASFAVYLDGEPLALAEAPGTVTGNANGTSALGRYDPFSRFQIDEFRLYRRTLSAAEAAALHAPAAPEPAPVITVHPADTRLAPGGTGTLAVQATGEHLFYEWFRGDTLLPDADGPVLALQGAGPETAGDYRVRISNPGGAVTSAPARVTVDAAPPDPFPAWAAAAGLAGDDALPGADPDRDGAPNASEFMHGTAPNRGEERPEFQVAFPGAGPSADPAVTFLRRIDAGPLRLDVEASARPDFAVPLGTTEVSRTPVPGGLERVVVRSNPRADAGAAGFFRFTLRR